MNQSYDNEDSDALDEAIKNILAMGGMTSDGCAHVPQNSDEMSELKKEQTIQCTNAHNNTQELYSFIETVSGGNNSVKMRLSAHAMDLLEGFQDLVDDDRHVGSKTLRAVIAAYVAQMLSAHAAKVIGAINSGEDQQAIKAINQTIETATPLSDEQLKKLKGEL